MYEVRVTALPGTPMDLQKTMRDIEVDLLTRALEYHGWIKARAAVMLGLNRTTLHEKMKRLEIRKPQQCA